MTGMQAISLFAGVGGIDLAMERAGIKVAAAVEINAAARKVLRRRFPYTAVYEDVTLVHSPDKCSGCDNCLPAGRIRVVAAGWPCQDLSVAGRRLGLGGKRSGLWWEVVRLLDELRPDWFIGENVPGLLSACCPCPGDGSCRTAGLVCGGEPHVVKGGVCPGGCMAAHGGAMGAVVGSLAELGYGHAYRVLDAQFLGVPQRRPRVILVGHSREWAAPAEVLLEPESSAGDFAPRRSSGQRVAPCLESGANSTGGTRPPGTTVDTAESLVVSTLQGGGGVAATASTQKRQRVDTSSRQVVAALTSNGVGTCGPDDNQAQAGHLIPTEPGGGGARTFQKVTRPASSDHPDVWEERDVAATLSPFDMGSDSRAVELVVQPVTHALTSEGADASEDGTGRGTPLIAVPLLEVGARTGKSTNDLRAGSGIGQSGDPMYTLQAGKQHGVGLHGEISGGKDGLARTVSGNHGQPGGVLDDVTVRRLTPLECERLQGFPDEWTAPQADAPRYRQMGNAVAVPVLEWVMRRVVATDTRIKEATDGT